MVAKYEITDKVRYLALVYRALQEAKMKSDNRVYTVSETNREVSFECYNATVQEPDYHLGVK